MEPPREVRETIDSFSSRRPADVPAAQWKEAVEWTSNLIAQDFFAPNQKELPGLLELLEQLQVKAREPVDLRTLQWIWEQCEQACGGPQSYGIRFRRIKLLTKGRITDERLPDVWSIDRCPGLDLSSTELTDASVDFLITLQHLDALDIRGTEITSDGAERLRAELPNCRVFHTDEDAGL